MSEAGNNPDTGTTVNNDCVIDGDFNRCPADAQITYNGITKLLDASLSCPLNAAAQSDFRTDTQKGLCTCAVSIYDEDVGRPIQTLGQTPTAEDDGQTINCECYICPEQFNSVAFICDQEVVGPCSSYNCFGDCNGNSSINYLSTITDAPTAAPDDGDAAAHLMASSSPTMWLVLGFMIVRMLRH
jgi:hypothetical protein